MDVLNRANLREVHDGLNFLGCIPWIINKEVLAVVNQVWEDGGGLADIPRRQHHEITQLPITQHVSEEERQNHEQLMRKLQDKNKDLRSLQADMAIKLKIANSFQNEDEIYFPVNLDFRGRVYPVPPNLNHIGSDMCRGILTFADKRELGAKGFEWLKIHVANLAGEDKVSLCQRCEYTEQHIEQVFDSADRPLDGDRWWLQSDKPWQTLAACKELAAALRHPEGAEKYASQLPIHQDGSCNGLQHYAALGRDIAGAQQVNLWQVDDKPGDVYSGVLQLVIRDIKQHSLGIFDDNCNSGDEGEQVANRKKKNSQNRVIKRLTPDRVQCLAQMVLPHINRKTVKQTVMTTVYGVTYIGAARQVYNRLREFAEPGQPLEHVSDRDIFDASSYVADLTLRSVGRLFEGADRVKRWLLHLAKEVSRNDEPVSWITPLGLPIIQPYRQPKKHAIPTVVQTVVLATADDDLPVHPQRQCSAFPPNYVHSLDSTHMLMTALRCKDRGLVFTAVHDSYWTHAATVDDMNTDLREAFVEMHSRPLLEDLRTSMIDRYPGLKLDPVPPLGDFDLEHVYRSQYFFN